jgi:MYND finger
VCLMQAGASRFSSVPKTVRSTMPHDIHSDPTWTQGSVEDVSPLVLLGLRVQRAMLIETNKTTPIGLRWQRPALDAQGNLTTVVRSAADIFEDKKQPTPTECNAASCINTAKKWCAQCHAVKYCSRECQLLDWKVINSSANFPSAAAA